MGVGIATGAFPGAGVEAEDVDFVAVEGEDLMHLNLMHLMLIHNKMAVIIMTLLHKAVVYFLDIFFLAVHGQYDYPSEFIFYHKKES